MRINKFLSRAGICSRREAKDLLLAKKITLNDEIVLLPATEVKLSDIVKYNGKKVEIKDLTIFLYYKPVGYLTTKKDPQNRKTIYDNLPNTLNNFLTVGRLDINSEGLLLLTNDGEYKRFLELPHNKIPRTYKVRIYGRFNEKHKKAIEKGVKVENVFYKAKSLSIIKIGVNSWLEITLEEGKNREIRKILGHFGYQVNRLIRTSYGKYSLGSLKAGEYEETDNKYSL